MLPETHRPLGRESGEPGFASPPAGFMSLWQPTH